MLRLVRAGETIPTPVELASLKLSLDTRKDPSSMTKSLDMISEIVRSSKHPFRKVDDQPAKAHKHRYERRKIREFIRLSDWAQENPA